MIIIQIRVIVLKTERKNKQSPLVRIMSIQTTCEFLLQLFKYFKYESHNTSTYHMTYKYIYNF
jgi:hypothetical protein